jgi:hypothetical protein
MTSMLDQFHHQNAANHKLVVHGGVYSKGVDTQKVTIGDRLQAGIVVGASFPHGQHPPPDPSGAAPGSHKLVVHGRIYCTGVDTPSDERVKIEVRSSLGGAGRSALAKICGITIKEWLYKPEIAEQLGLPAGVQLGPFAQELQKIIPEAVRIAGDLMLDMSVTDEKGNVVNEIKDFLVVDYQRLSVMTLQATQELSAVIELLIEKLTRLASEFAVSYETTSKHGDRITELEQRPAPTTSVVESLLKQRATSNSTVVVPSLKNEVVVHLDGIFMAILSVDHGELIASGSDEYERLKAKTKRRLENGSNEIELHDSEAARCVPITLSFFLI